MASKKLIFLIIDGMADDPRGEFLAKSNIPNLDYLAANGKVGRVYTLRGQEPESDVAIVRLFGYDTSKEGYPGRGPLEAYGAGLIKPGEKNYLAWRANFATLEEKSSIFNAEVLDSRVGRTLTTKHANLLADYLNKKASERYERKGIDIKIYPTVEHRAVVVFKGKRFSPDVSNLDPFYVRQNDGTTRAVKPAHPKVTRSVSFSDRSSEKSFTADIVSDYVSACYEWLRDFKINEREKNGLKTANGVLMRNAGNRIIDLKSVLNFDWAAHVGMPMERGIAMAGGMDLSTFNYKQIDLNMVLKVKNNPLALYEHFFRNLEVEISEYNRYLKKLEKDFEADAAWLHFKQLDIAGHDGLIDKKREMLERIDESVIAKVREMVETGKYVAIITSDHATVCSKKAHTSDPVPLLINGMGKDDAKEFSEKAYMKSRLVLDGIETFFLKIDL